MNSRIATLILVVAGLVVGGALLHPLVKPLEASVVRQGDRTPVGAAGILGGLRTLAADLVWLRAYAHWERRDVAATEGLLALTTALDPRPLYFWLNGARIMAYDVPAWRIRAAGGFGNVSAAEQAKINAEQAQRALDFLAEAERSHPHAAALWIEAANIELNRRHAVAAAAECYRRAAEQPDAPYYAARIYAELLRRLGRNQEALTWLKQLYPTLPPQEEAAAASLVHSRIIELERELRGSSRER